MIHLRYRGSIPVPENEFTVTHEGRFVVVHSLVKLTESSQPIGVQIVCCTPSDRHSVRNAYALQRRSGSEWLVEAGRYHPDLPYDACSLSGVPEEVDLLIVPVKKTECEVCHGRLGDVMPDGTFIPCQKCSGKGR